MTEPTGRPHTDFDERATSMQDVDPEVFEELLGIRHSIDNIDAALIHLLAERFAATQRVGELKAAHTLPAGDPGREAAQIKRLRSLAEDAHLDPEFAEKFLNFIVSEVIRHHERIAEDVRNQDEAGGSRAARGSRDAESASTPEDAGHA